MAHDTANNSSSMMAYRDSVSEMNRDPAWMSTQLSPTFCWRTNPSPWRLASVHNLVGLFGSKYDSVGAEVSDSFALMNAWSSSDDQVNSFFVLRRGRRGVSSPASVAVLADSWFARPTKDRRSVRLVGVGNLAMASMID